MSREEEGSLVAQPTLSAPAPAAPAAGAGAAAAEPGFLAADIEIEDVVHAIESFKAVIRPVAVVMLLVSWAVVNVVRQGPHQSKLLVFDEGADKAGGASVGVMFAHAAANAVAIICVFGFTTLIIVGCYKCQCMSCMKGYMMFSTTVLLGVMGGVLLHTALDAFNIIISSATFVLVGWNFVVVGLAAIFYQKGLPDSAAQFYLAASSGIMAWQLSTKLPEWTSWTLLILLAFYDLFAVLSPHGPLKMMVEVMVEQQEFLPGMLYEADIEYTVAPMEEDAYEMAEGGGHGGYQSAAEAAAAEAELAFATSPGAAAAMAAQMDFKRQQEAADRAIERKVGRSYGEATGGLSGTQDFIKALAAGNHQESVKLGLGDFIFYSMLVAKAGQFDWCTLAACFLVILVGLSGTLLVVSIFRHAIPALPVSIGLGVLFYLMTRLFILPFITELNGLGVVV
jgi:presenilin 1